MSKQKFFISKNTITLFVVYADDSISALEMVKNKRYRPSGSETIDGYTEVISPIPIVEYKVVDVPAKEGVEVNE